MPLLSITSTSSFFSFAFAFYDINFILHIVLLSVIMYSTVKRMAEMGKAVLCDQGITDISDIR